MARVQIPATAHYSLSLSFAVRKEGLTAAKLFRK